MTRGRSSVFNPGDATKNEKRTRSASLPSDAQGLGSNYKTFNQKVGGVGGCLGNPWRKTSLQSNVVFAAVTLL